MHLHRLNRLLLAATFAAVLSLGVPAALASARSLPAAPFQPPEYAPAPIHIQAPPPTRSIVRRTRAEIAEISPLALKSTNGLTLADSGVSACAPDPLRRPNSNEFSAANQLERLRSTASGKVLPEYQQLSKARQQRLQAEAAWQMGLLTLHGICAVLNTADAAAWFERAELLGEPLAAAGLAWCEIEGCRAAAHPAAAGKWVELLRGVDAPRALYLQWLMQSRLAPLEISQPVLGAAGQTRSPLQNRQLLVSAAQQGDTNAKIELGLDSVLLNELPQALAFFKSAAPKSAAAAINSTVVAERVKNAASLMPPNRVSSAIAVKSQSAAENFAQAQRYHRGEGVPSNYTEAIRLYQLAQNQGNVSAKKILALIFSRPAPNGQIDLAWMQQLAQVDVSGASPTIEQNNLKLQLRREPTPLFDLVPLKWRRYVLPTIAS